MPPPAPADAEAAADAELCIRAKWPEKFTDTLRYRRVAETTYPDGSKRTREYRATIEVAMHKRDGDTATLSWTYTRMTLNGKPQPDLKLELSVTLGDGPVELHNIEDVQRAIIDQAVKLGPKSDKPQALGGDELVKLARNRDALTIFVTRDVAAFFFPLDTTVRPDRAVEYDTEIAGLGGDTLKAVDRWTMLSAQGAPAGTVGVEWTQVVDERDIERYFTQLGQIAGMKIDARKAKISRNGKYALDRETFWPHVVLVKSDVGAEEGQSQFESVGMVSALLDPDWRK